MAQPNVLSELASILNSRGAHTTRGRMQGIPVSKFIPNSNIPILSSSEHRSITNEVITKLKKTKTNPHAKLHILLLSLAVVVHQIQRPTAASTSAGAVANQRQYVAAAARVVEAADELELLVPPLLAREHQDESELAPVGRKLDERNAATAGENFATTRNHLIEFLETLPVSSVGQKHTAQFECDLPSEDDGATASGPSNSKQKLVWLKLVRPEALDTPNSTRVGVSVPANDITPLSLDKRIITPDKRFKVRHQPPSRWLLSIENVSPADDKAYFVCQVSGGGGGGGTNNQNFLGGGRLNVLMPPKIVDSDTSANLVLANEFSPLKLQCKVISEQQSQISWRREDGHSLDGLELRFKHQLERRPHQLLSIDSSELVFGPVRREQAAAYLCIASNGVQPGVSQRISVVVENCRDIEGPEGRPEPCRQEGEPTVAAEDDVETTQAPPQLQTTSTTTRGPTTQTAHQQQQQNRSNNKRTWTTTSVRANVNGTMATTRRQQTGDKSSRTSMRYNNNGNNRQEPASKRVTGPTAKRDEGDNEPNGSSPSSPVRASQISAIWPVLVSALICAARSIALARVSIDRCALHFAHTI